MINKKYKDVRIAIIGGTGVYDPKLLTDVDQLRVYTPYGSPSDLITVGVYAGTKIAFLPRHGVNHQLPPHKVPYRANVWALKELGVNRIIAPCAVGSLRKDIQPGKIVIPDQFIDFTKTRQYSFFDGGRVAHVAMHEPFCSELRNLAIESAEEIKVDFNKTGTTVTIEGPRYSTIAESIFFRDCLKADIIGMTLVPECQLARELEICYLSLAAVTDYDAWSDDPVSAAEVLGTMKTNLGIAFLLRKILVNLIPKIPEKRDTECDCWNALNDALH